MVVRAVDKGDIEWNGSVSPNIFELAFLLQSYEPNVRDYFRERAVVPLRRRVSQNLANDLPSNLWDRNRDAQNKRKAYQSLAKGYLFALQALIRFGYSEDGNLLVKAARKPHYDDSLLWSSLFDHARRSHPKPEEILNALRKPLPENFCQIAFLDFSNALCAENRVSDHPFDTGDGFEILLKLIDQEDVGYDSYVVSAAKASSFLPGERAQSIIKCIRKHKFETVRAEAEWAETRMGGDKANKFLLKKFQTVQFHSRAAKYLDELGIEHPPIKASDEVRFKSLVDYCDWMANEQDLFGFPPQNIKVLSKQVVTWPVHDQRIPFWRVSYKTKDPYDGELIRGVSLVSPVGFSRYFEEKEDKQSAFQEAVAFDENYKLLVENWPDLDWCAQRLEELNPGLFK